MGDYGHGNYPVDPGLLADKADMDRKREREEGPNAAVAAYRAAKGGASK